VKNKFVKEEKRHGKRFIDRLLENVEGKTKEDFEEEFGEINFKSI